MIKIIKKVIEIISIILDGIENKRIRIECKNIGINSKFQYPVSTLGLGYISIGRNCNIRKDFKLRAYNEFSTFKFQPEITIGDNFYSGTQSCIAIIGKLHIGNNVTLASRVTIIDHAHGLTDYSDIEIPVMKRELSTKGPIIIEDNVWIGEGVVVLSGVTIGKNSIIGANAVITKDIPEYAIAVGIPAKVIKTIAH